MIGVNAYVLSSQRRTACEYSAHQDQPRCGEVLMARFVSEKEAAEYIGVDTSLVRAWVACGRLPQPIPDCGKFDLRAMTLY